MSDLTVIGNLPESIQTSKEAHDLFSKIAMDIGKEVVHHIEIMYPNAIKATSSTFKLSVRNFVHNEIMSAIKFNDEGQILSRMETRKKFRRKINSFYKNIRKKPHDPNPRSR